MSAAEPAQWTRALCSLLIEEWRIQPCLWQIKSAEYKDRNVRSLALIHLKEVLHSQFTIEDIKKKLHTLRCQYRKEKQLFEKSTKSGAGTSDVYIPKLWCYNNLHFLHEGDINRESTSSLDHTVTNSQVSDIHFQHCVPFLFEMEYIQFYSYSIK